MRLDGTFLRSRLARRVFLMFVLCALIPISGLAFISFRSVTQQLDEQTRERIREENRAVANGIFERLEMLQAQLDAISVELAERAAGDDLDAAAAGEPADGDSSAVLETSLERFGDNILGVEVVPSAAAPFTATQSAHLLAGRTLLATNESADGEATVLLARVIAGNGDVVVATIEPRYVWQTREGTLPAGSDLCVLGADSRPLYCSPGVAASSAAIGAGIAARRAVTTQGRTDAGTLELALGDEAMLANYRDVPVQFQFHLPQLTSVVMRRKNVEIAPLARFNLYFAAVVALSLVVVLLLSSIQIRRSLEPVAALQHGTRRIAERDFKTRIAVSTGDELEQLADSFNVMADRLDKQFSALAVSGEIDRAILSALDSAQIAATVAQRLPSLFGCAAVRLLLPQTTADAPSATAAATRAPAPPSTTALAETDLEMLAGYPEGLLCEPNDAFPQNVAALRESGPPWWFLLPMRLDGAIVGALGLGFPERPAPDQDRREIVRQIADQVAVALANARLLDELERLNWGTLMALARTVDAKSPWTAGHSERVTEMAMKIGAAMDLSATQLDTLHRGGLVHDIGKIGIPARVLDKVGRLDDEEMELMREHPRKGERILAPIPGYESIIPIVVQHHERFDGNGYPDGLAGGDIDPLARILAVADVYDALISDRPYRKGMGLDKVVGIITDGAGSHFDPEVVAAFLDVTTASPGRVAGRHPARIAG